MHSTGKSDIFSLVLVKAPARDAGGHPVRGPGGLRWPHLHMTIPPTQTIFIPIYLTQSPANISHQHQTHQKKLPEALK